MCYFLLLVTSLFLLAAACTKEDDSPADPLDELPPATQVGANTFGCLIDGVPFVNQGGGNAARDVSGSYQTMPYELLSVVGKELNLDPEDFLSRSVLFRSNNIDEGIVTPDFSQYSYMYRNATADDRYYIDSTKQYRYEIIFHDASRNVVAGIFENTSYCPATGDTIHITDGRFDVIYFE